MRQRPDGTWTPDGSTPTHHISRPPQAWFDGWRDLSQTQVDLAQQLRAGPATVAEPKSWLMRVGWRRRGLVRVNEVPAPCKR